MATGGWGRSLNTETNPGEGRESKESSDILEYSLKNMKDMIPKESFEALSH